MAHAIGETESIIPEVKIPVERNWIVGHRTEVSTP
jgi:hypothetical protein